MTTFNFATGEWAIDWPGRVAQHDVIYLSPPTDPLQGMPIGNGDVGALAWCEDSRLIMAINKCDLWDAAPFTRFHNWAADEEDRSSALRHACRLVIDFGVPVFDIFYLSDFRGRISLADAALHIEAQGPFGAITLDAFVAHDTGLLCCELSCQLHDAPPVEISLERYGSRTFGHWYSLVNRDASVGLSGTLSSVTDAAMYVQHVLTSGTFAIGCHVEQGAEPVMYARQSAHCVTAQVASSGPPISIITTVTSPLDEDAQASAQGQLTAACEVGIAALRQSHAQAWRSFWLRSYMSFGDDYLDNLWHLTMYYANASQRGKYPGRFINGLWNWNRDAQNWTFYFHWNQQETYWPLNAAGHHELAQPYLEYRFAALPHSKQDAGELFGAAGAFVSDVCDYRGYNSLSELENHTPVAQVALDFWRQYQYTRDAVFLRERALPYLVEAASFFESLFERADDGLYHAKCGTGYEGWIKLRDAITELACAEALFAAVLAANKECPSVAPEHVARWEEILTHLAPLPTIAPAGCIVQQEGHYCLLRGPYKGQSAQSDQVFAAGYGIAEGRWMTSKVAGDPPLAPTPPDIFALIQRLESNASPYSMLQDDLQYYEGIFPSVELSPIFPAGLVSIADQGSALYDAAVNTVRLYSPEVMGWDTPPLAMARLGLADELAEVLRRFPSRWQFYCNGFGHYGPRDIMKADGALRFRTSLVMDAALPAAERAQHKFPMPMWPFRHMGMESMSVLACAMNESLLHSHASILRIAPTVTTSQRVRFTLHAVGGFIVSAEVTHGHPLWVHARSLHGEVCALANPWDEMRIYRNGQLAGITRERIARVDTQVGDQLVFMPADKQLGDFAIEVEHAVANDQSKSCPLGLARLGLPRMF